MPTFDTLPNWLAHLETAHPVGIDMGLARISRVRDALGRGADELVGASAARATIRLERSTRPKQIDDPEIH